MDYRAFGRSEIGVSAIGYGAGQLGDPALGNQQIGNLLSRLQAMGVNLIDTARGYGSSEARIGELLPGQRADWVISTKIGYGIEGLADWTHKSDFSWRTSLLVSPKDGQLPPLTPQGQKLFETGRSGWVPGQEYDPPADFDAWDRCITRGFPASMLPNRYNHGLQVFQSPGYIVIVNEMLGRRVIPILPKDEVGRHWPKQVEAWWGNSRAYWDGKTLVIETSNLKSGDSVSEDIQKRAAAPVIVTMIGGAPLDTIPVSTRAHAVEKLTMTGPDSMLYEVTYDDPDVFTAPWTAQEEWNRNDKYQMFEYACLEGDVQIRGYISASRAARKQIAAGTRKAETVEQDSRSRFTKIFDFDPVAPGSPQPGAGAAGAANGG